VSLSTFWKTGQNPCKNKHGENCIVQVACWYFVRLCGAAGVGGEVSLEKNHQNISIFKLHCAPPNSQRVQTSFMSLPACWKTGQNPCKNKHGENCIAQVLRWYFVRLCGAAGVGGEVSHEKKTSKYIHIQTALFTTRTHKDNIRFLPYQPTSGKLWPT